MNKSRVFLLLLVSFIIGVFIRSFYVADVNLYFLGLLVVILLLIIFYRNFKASLIAFVLLFFIFGAWRTEIFLQQANQASEEGKTFTDNALVVKSSPSSFGQSIIIELEKTKIAMLAQVPQYPNYQYGDLVAVTCTAKTIENLPTGQAGKDSEFDYRMYMAKEGVLYSCENKKITKIASKEGNIFLRQILQTRQLFEHKINLLIPQPEGALASGLLFGGNAGLSKDIQGDFSRTGMTHIVAVSGYNVTIIAEYLILFAINVLGLWRSKAIWFALVGIGMFVIMSGLPASAVRAGVMGGILLWAMKNGRLTSAENAIIFAGAIMLYLNPLLLRWDVGFQLSFLATLGIVLTSSFWEKSFVKKHQALGISEAVALSLSAQIFVLPIIALNFHITSLISLLANIFILPLIPLSMLLIFLVSVSSLLFMPLAMIFAWFSYFPLHFELQFIHLLAQFPWASVTVEQVKVEWIVTYYMILAGTLIYLKKLALANKN